MQNLPYKATGYALMGDRLAGRQPGIFFSVPYITWHSNPTCAHGETLSFLKVERSSMGTKQTCGLDGFFQETPVILSPLLGPIGFKC